MTVGKRSDRNITSTLARALELTEEALSEVARIAIEEIHSDLESSNHVQAAERDMRSALKQLVMADRDLRAKSVARTPPDARREEIAEVVPGPGSDVVRSGA
jgi:prophage DNA circulation protein